MTFRSNGTFIFVKSENCEKTMQCNYNFDDAVKINYVSII